MAEKEDNVRNVNSLSIQSWHMTMCAHIKLHSGEEPHTGVGIVLRLLLHQAFIDSIWEVMQKWSYTAVPIVRSLSVHRGPFRNVREAGENSFACDQCAKSFIESSPLKSLIRTHSGETPYAFEPGLGIRDNLIRTLKRGKIGHRG